MLPSTFHNPSSFDGLVVDLFAGGGGASEGLALALGRDPDIAINHDAEALEMHKANYLLNDIEGRWMDNVMIERPWRSVKWECLYLREVETGSQARKILRDRFQFYNEQRPHTAFDGRRPIEVY